jgi:hypothetical protein
MRKSIFILSALLIVCMMCLSHPLIGEEMKLYYLGASSNASGYVTQINNQGIQSYIKFNHVAPVVNRLRIVNTANGTVMFDGRPEPGVSVYLPVGMYVVTGWSQYGTEDMNAVSIAFQSAPEPVTSPAPAQVTVDGNSVQPSQNTTTVYTSPAGSAYPYYYYPDYGNYINCNTYCPPPGPCPQPAPSYIWCTYCGKYHAPGGCAFTMKRKSVNDPYNPYWRGYNPHWR